MEEEVLNKYKVEENKKGTFRGRGSPLEWKRERRNKKYRIRKWGEDCWARLFSLLGAYHVQRLQGKQEEQTVEEQHQIMATMRDLIKKIRSKGSMDAQNRWCVAELPAKWCEKAWTHSGREDTMQNWYEWLEYMKKKDEKEKWRRCNSEKGRR